MNHWSQNGNRHGTPSLQSTTPAALCLPPYTFGLSRAVGSYVTSPSALPSPSVTSTPGTPSPGMAPGTSQLYIILPMAYYLEHTKR